MCTVLKGNKAFNSNFGGQNSFNTLIATIGIIQPSFIGPDSLSPYNRETYHTSLGSLGVNSEVVVSQEYLNLGLCNFNIGALRCLSGIP